MPPPGILKVYIENGPFSFPNLKYGLKPFHSHFPHPPNLKITSFMEFFISQGF